MKEQSHPSLLGWFKYNWSLFPSDSYQSVFNQRSSFHYCVFDLHPPLNAVFTATSCSPSCFLFGLFFWCRSKLYLLWCRMLSSERQYVAVLKGVEETYLPLLELSDTPTSIRGKGDALFPSWASLSSFHSHDLLPAMEGALMQSLLQQDCFSKYVRKHQQL